MQYPITYWFGIRKEFIYRADGSFATEEIDRLHTTAASHERCFVVECMGRHTAGSPCRPALLRMPILCSFPSSP